jgi:Tfp pilus assembly protein PilV
MIRAPRSGHAGCNARRAVRGSSFVEVLVVILLMSIGFLGMVATQTRAFQVSVSAEDTARAVALAEEISAAMWNANDVNLPAATVSTWAARVADPSAGGLPSGTGEVAVSGAVARVTVRWTAPQSGLESRYVTDVTIARATP